MLGPPVARMNATPGCFMNIAVLRRLPRSRTHCTSSTGAPCCCSTAWMISPVWFPTPSALRWQLTIRALRALRQIKVLKTKVETGLVSGTMPNTTPMGLAISVTRRASSTSILPAAGRSTKDRQTLWQAKRILITLSAATPMPVSCTQASARAGAAAATASAIACSSASIRSSGQSASSRCAAAARATIACVSASISSAKRYSATLAAPWRSLADRSRPTACRMVRPMAGCCSQRRSKSALANQRAATSVCA